jgi:succinate dehydrogenase/fumarate reductase cytochrome b subunit
MQANQLSMSPLRQGTVSGLITWQTIALQTEAGEYEWDWAAFVKHRMSGAIILLYRSQQAMIVLSRSLVASDDDWQRLQDHVQATVPARTPWRPSYAFWVALGAIILGLLWGLLGLLTE